MAEKSEISKARMEPSSPNGFVPRPGKWILWLAGLASVAFHVSSFIPLSYYASNRLKAPRAPNVIKFRTTSIDPKKIKPTDPDSPIPDVKRLVETPQKQTKPPVEVKRLGPQDHVTEKETKVKKRNDDMKTADAGNKGNPIGGGDTQVPDRPDVDKTNPVKPVPQDPKDIALTPPSPSKATSKIQVDGKIPMIERPKPRNAYESMLPSSKDLYGQVNAGYQEYIDDEVDEGDRIDLNTAEYKYISYFTKIRKAINLVWIYPTEAVRRGISGEVQVEWTIMKDGTVKRVRIVKSSGYDVLDDAIIGALKLASPFPNLPDAWKVERKVIVGAFKYVLTDYAGNH